MPFPDQISATAFPVLSFPGPWKAPNAALYVALADTLATFKIQIWKSIDDGVTWNIMDVANSPAGGSGATPYAGVLNGSDLWIIGANAAQTFEQVTKFSTATDTWSAATVTTNSAAGASRSVQAFFRTSDGNLVISKTVQAFFVGGRWRTGYFTFDTAALTFSAWIKNGETGASVVDWECNAILAGAGECDFLFWSRDSTAPGGTRTVWRQPLSDVGVLGAKVSIDAITDAGSTPATPAGFSDGITGTVIWVPTDVSPLASRVFKAPVSTWVFPAPQTLTAPGTETAIDNVAIVNSAAAGMIAFLSTNAPGVNENFWDAVDAGPGLGALALIGTIPLFNFAADQLWANLFPNPHWAIVIQNNGTVVNFWIAAAGPPAGVGGPAKIIDTSLIAPVILPDPHVLCCFGKQIRIQICGKMAYPISRGAKSVYP